MGVGGAVAAADAVGSEELSAGKASAAADRGRDLLRGADRVRVAATAEELSALADGLLALHLVARRRNRRARPQRPTRAGSQSRRPRPQYGLIDSQSASTADTVPAATRGFDAGKKVKGRKRFIVTDTLGLLLSVHVVAASV